VIANAAIVGPEGPVSALEEFATAMRQRFDRGLLESLVAGGLLELDGDWWRFRSDVVREVAYQTLTKQTRAQRHAGVARVMAREADAPIDKHAHHAATAAELLAELGSGPRGRPVDPGRSDRAARASRARSYDIGGTATAPSSPVGRSPWSTTTSRSAASCWCSTPPPSSSCGRSTTPRPISRSPRRGDRCRRPGDRGGGARLLGVVAQRRGDLVTARQHLGAAVDLFRQIDDRPRLALALRARGFAEVLGGSLQDAEWYLGEADALYTELGDARGRAWVAQHRSWVMFLSGDHAAAEQHVSTRRSRTFEAIGDHSGVNWSRGLLAFVQYFQRRFDAADRSPTRCSSRPGSGATSGERR
jgi:hypothetical protein